MRFAEIFKTELFSKYGQKAGCYINEIYDIIINKNNLIYQDDFSKYAEKIWRMMKHNVLFEDRF